MNANLLNITFSEGWGVGWREYSHLLNNSSPHDVEQCVKKLSFVSEREERLRTYLYLLELKDKEELIY